MGIETNVKLPTGFEATYFKVSKNIAVDYDQKQAVFTLLGFKDEQAKKEGLLPTVKQNIAIQNEIEEVITQRPLTLQEIKNILPVEKRTKTTKIGNGSIVTNISDEELLEACKDLKTDVVTKNEKPYFDDFIAYFEQGKYLEGVYNFIKTNSNLKQFLGKTKDVI